MTHDPGARCRCGHPRDSHAAMPGDPSACWHGIVAGTVGDGPPCPCDAFAPADAEPTDAQLRPPSGPTIDQQHAAAWIASRDPWRGQ